LTGNVDCLKRLIQLNADIWIRNKRDDYPIHEAVNSMVISKRYHSTDELNRVQVACRDTVRYILTLYPSKVNCLNGEHRTLLHLAASLGDTQMCQVLIECGAQVNIFIRTSAVS
jgi:hypothetical protein